QENAETPTTACDGLRNTKLGELPWRILRARLRRIVAVTDEEVEAARAELLARELGPVEPSGAATVAALHAGKVESEGTTACVVSGGNV
ncbi:MAG: pyridoxal-phosphate dependent enzyme, partial [Acidobacteriota bacterium]